MASGQACGEDGTKGALVTCNSIKNVRHVPRCITENSDMLSLGAELHRNIADLDWIGYFCKLNPEVVIFEKASNLVFVGTRVTLYLAQYCSVIVARRCRSSMEFATWTTSSALPIEEITELFMSTPRPDLCVLVSCLLL